MIFPGKSIFSPPKPPALSAPPPIPTREDPAIAAARDKLRLSEKRRRGRRAAILAPPEDSLSEPIMARGSQILGR